MIESLSTPNLETRLRDARERSLALTADLSDGQLTVPLLDTINPFLWEMGHLAYFAEFWTLRNLYGDAPILPNADSLYDSAKIPHDDRWSLPLPSRSATQAFMATQLERVVDALRRGRVTAHDASYFHTLAVYHEDMHGEALIYTRQTLAYAQPTCAAGARPTMGGPLIGDVRIKGGTYRIGALLDDGFVFDNEKWAHAVDVGPFSIARAPVTNSEFLAFVQDGGYDKRALWSDVGWAWRASAGAKHPQYWVAPDPSGGKNFWRRRHFDQIITLRDHEPVCHVNWFEANAYCAWAHRRLPTEAEWEVAATGGSRRRFPWGEEPPTNEHANLDAAIGDVVDVATFERGESPTGCRQMLGNVWEWTSTPFEPYPEFSPDPYKEYSAPWFGTHMVLRGGAWSTRGRLITTRWRNFYRPHRRDIITGLRTCSL